MKTTSTFTYLFLSLALLASCSILSSDNGDDFRPIVFSAKIDDDDTYQIYTMREDGSGIKQLTNFQYSATSPAWSPDGNRIVFSTPTEGLSVNETLWVMDTKGENKEPLVYNPRTGNPQFGDHPSWSPDGTKLAFDKCLNCEAGGQNHEIFVADLETGTIDTVTKNFIRDLYPQWSPDGNHIAFLSNRHKPDDFHLEVYLLNVNDGEIQRVTNSDYYIGSGGVIWLDEGNEFYYWTDNRIFRLNLETSVQSEISMELNKNLFRFTPYDVSPDTSSMLLLIRPRESGSDKNVSMAILDLSSGKIKEIASFHAVLGRGDWRNSHPVEGGSE